MKLFSYQHNGLYFKGEQGNSKSKEHFVNICMNLGTFEIAYSNEILKHLLEILIELKSLNCFRDFDIVGFLSFQSKQKTSVSRKIDLMMPFYIVKKLVEQNKHH